MNCQGCKNEEYLNELAEKFRNADRMASDGISAEKTDPIKWDIVDQIDKLCDKHKKSMFEDFDL